MRKISLTQGKVALVDDADFEWLMQWKWCADNHGRVTPCWYAVRRLPKGSKPTRIYMHQAITGVRGTDHADANGLNNQRANLRECSQSQNAGNARIQSNNKSGFKGVFWYKRDQKWSAGIHVRGRDIFLGRFLDIHDAARAYADAAKKHFGEFARIR